MNDISAEHLKTIVNIFNLIQGEEDIEQLLLDVCTLKELEAIFQRFKVAQMLKNGLSFNQIEEKTGMSSTTITRVSKCLKNGKGYNKMFNKYNFSMSIDN
ncbi:DNA-binding transcriptional regulator [Mycoplasmatota bacterium]|nr:DNA-binding transcriptional regulator [Mycoplasmatota bacterium]